LDREAMRSLIVLARDRIAGHYCGFLARFRRFGSLY
jgi:hypothetical protein